MNPNTKNFLIRAAVFILLILLVFPYIRHFFVHAPDEHGKMWIVYSTESISLIIAISFVILFFMLKKKLAEIEIKKQLIKNIFFFLLAIALFFLAFQLEPDFNDYMNMGAVHIQENRAYLGSGWIFGESIHLGARSITNSYMEKQILLENISDVRIRWYGSWAGKDEFNASMIANNNTYDITFLYKDLKPGEKSWLEIEIPEENLFKGNNSIALRVQGDENQSDVNVYVQSVYENNVLSIYSKPSTDDAFLHATSPYSKFFKFLLDFKFLIKILAIISLFIAIFGVSAAKSLVQRKESVIALMFAYISYFFSFIIQSYWKFFSDSTAAVSYFVLKIISPYAVVAYSSESPLIGIKPFIVDVYQQCSGTEGIGFFVIMSLIIMLIDWNKISKKRLWIIPLGLVGMFLTNCLRITSIILIGRYISPEFAVGTFHTNIGWVLFILYFIVFWYFVYGWLMKK